MGDVELNWWAIALRGDVVPALDDVQAVNSPAGSAETAPTVRADLKNLRRLGGKDFSIKILAEEIRAEN
jgi:hypothetical protein